MLAIGCSSWYNGYIIRRKIMVKGSHHSPETIEKLAAKTRAAMTEERRKKHGEMMRKNYPAGPNHFNSGAHRSKESRDKMSKSAIGKHVRDKHGRWNGGISLHMRGYILKAAHEHPDVSCRGYILEHRLVVESVIGRYLNKQEVVHHINKNKADNRPQNLMAFINHAAHKRFERGNQVGPEEVVFDGRLLSQ
jgi:hypothetical protein